MGRIEVLPSLLLYSALGSIAWAINLFPVYVLHAQETGMSGYTDTSIEDDGGESLFSHLSRSRLRATSDVKPMSHVPEYGVK